MPIQDNATLDPLNTIRQDLVASCRDRIGDDLVALAEQTAFVVAAGFRDLHRPTTS